MGNKWLVSNPLRDSYDTKSTNNSDLNCPFCNGISQNYYHIKKYIHWCVVANQYPFEDYANLIIPERHIEFVHEINEIEWKELSEIMFKLGSIWTNHYLKDFKRSDKQQMLDNNKPSYNFYVNNGEYSGRSVEHLHWHFIPRIYRQLTAMEIIEPFRKVKKNPEDTMVLFKK